MLYIMIIGVLVTTGAVYSLISNTQSASFFESGSQAYAAAENGVENALLRLIRNPSYSGETLTMDGGQGVVITVNTASGTSVIMSSGTYGNTMKQVEVKVHYNGGVLYIDSWKDFP